MNPGIQDIHTHPGASALLSSGKGFFMDIEMSRGPLIDFSESEEDLSSDDPEQEGLDVRSAAKERRKGP